MGHNKGVVKGKLIDLQAFIKKDKKAYIEKFNGTA